MVFGAVQQDGAFGLFGARIVPARIETQTLGSFVSRWTNAAIFGASAVIVARLFVETRRTDGQGAIVSVETLDAVAVVGAVGVISARGAVLARRQDARVVEFAATAVVARMAETLETGRFERDLTLARSARPVQ